MFFLIFFRLVRVARPLADKEIKRGELKAIPLCDSSVGRKFYVIHHKDKLIFKGLENLLDTMKDWKTEYQCDKDQAH